MHSTDGYRRCRSIEACRVAALLARALMGDDPAHGWPHIERVLSWAEAIVKAEGLTIDWDVLWNAVMLHDIGRYLPGKGHHAVKSAEAAETILGAMGYPPEVVEAIVDAILAHSYSLGAGSSSTEARVLSDADKLDALGAVGVARVIHHGCTAERSFEESLRHIEEKILRLPELMHYSYSRAQAERLAGIVRLFHGEMKKQLEGPRL